MRVVLLCGLLLWVPGCELVEDASKRTAELRAGTEDALVLQEEILRAYFTEEMVQRTVGHLALSRLGTVEAVPSPRPRIEEVTARFGPPDEILELDLGGYGIARQARVHFFGRLGLGTPKDGPAGEVFWLVLREAPRD